MPKAQMPIDASVLVQEGLYSTIAPSGVGMNPGITSPMPF
jgi:hypothetical protein